MVINREKVIRAYQSQRPNKRTSLAVIGQPEKKKKTSESFPVVQIIEYPVTLIRRTK